MKIWAFPTFLILETLTFDNNVSINADTKKNNPLDVCFYGDLGELGYGVSI